MANKKEALTSPQDPLMGTNPDREYTENFDMQETTKKTRLNLLRPNQLQGMIDFIYKKYDIRKNIIAQDFELWNDESGIIKDLNLSDIWIDCHENNHTGATPDKIKNIIKCSKTKEYSPLYNYLEKLQQWDGKDYFVQLATYLHIEETEHYQFVYHFRKWFVRLVRCMIDDKYFNKQMIIFLQEEQNGGKTTLCRWLCPKELQKYYTETITSGKDEDIQLATNFLICYDELNKLHQAQLDNIKSLMSRLYVNVRLPYDKRQTLLNRRCSFLGNTNRMEFMKDETGSIRFICFVLKSKINFAYSKEMNVDNLYSQAYYLLKSGTFDYEISNADSEQIQEYNKQFFVTTSEIQLLQKYFRNPTKEDEINGKCLYLTTTEILQSLQGLSNISMRFNLNSVGQALKFLNYKSISKRMGGSPIKCYPIVKQNFVQETKK